jgi:MFS transporter, DHA1 family, multidrug resistance protein
LIGGFAVEAKDWHWSLLELLWLCAPLFVFLFFFLPETSSDNILLRRAARLRKLTGNPLFKSQSELKQANMSAKEIAFNALVKPWQLNALDPAILFSTVYVSLCYSIFYTFFEAFPLVFPVMHGFSLGETGLAFVSVPIGLMIAIPAQLLHYFYYAEPFLIENGQPAPEYWLRPALIGNVFGPIGLFIFGEI